MAAANDTAHHGISKTAQAVAYFRDNQDKGVTRYAAAKKFGILPGTLYRALDNLEATAEQRCPCCGQLVPSKV